MEAYSCLEPRRTSSKGAAWRDALLALITYAAITVAMFLPLVRHIFDSFPVDLGDPPNESWLVAWGVHALTTDPSQLLQGNIYFPHANALIYNDNLLGLLPLSTPLFLLSGGNTAFTYNALFLLSFCLCGLFTFLLARRLTGSLAGAFLAGIIVAFSPYRMVHLSHLNQLSGQWLPLVLLFWERARAASMPDSGRPAWPEFAVMALFLALQALCSIYYAAFLSSCLALYLLLYLWRAGWRQARRFVLGVLVSGAALAAALLPVFLPYLRLQGRVGTVRGPAQVLEFSADVRDFLHMPRFSVLYGWTEDALGVPSRDSHQYLFPGIVALALMFYAWRRRNDVPERLYYTAMLVLTAVLSLGLRLKLFDRVYNFPLPFAALYDHVPAFHSFRDPARFFYIGFVCIALLAAWGVSALEDRLRAWRRARRVVFVGLLCLAALAEYWITPIATPRVAVGDKIPPVYQWLKAQPAHTPVLELPIGQQDAIIWSHQALMTYFATYHWQPIVNGVGGYTPDGYEADARILNRWPDAASSRLLLSWGVRYVIWHADWVGRGAPPMSASIIPVKIFTDGTEVFAVTRIG